MHFYYPLYFIRVDLSYKNLLLRVFLAMNRDILIQVVAELEKSSYKLLLTDRYKT
jgi:hypothetical protein